MSDTVFREAKAAEPTTETTAPEPKGDTPSTSVVTEDTLIYTYEQENGHPYTAKYMGIADVYDSEVFGKEVGEIESYLKQQVSDKALDNSVEAAQKLLKKLEKQADIDPTEPTNTKISKLAAYVRFKSEIRQHELERRKWSGSA